MPVEWAFYAQAGLSRVLGSGVILLDLRVGTFLEEEVAISLSAGPQPGQVICTLGRVLLGRDGPDFRHTVYY